MHSPSSKVVLISLLALIGAATAVSAKSPRPETPWALDAHIGASCGVHGKIGWDSVSASAAYCIDGVWVRSPGEE